MNINELDALLDKVNENEARKIADEKLNEIKKLDELKSILREQWGSKIKEWITLSDHLAKRGFVITSRLFGEFFRVPECQKGLCTDGVYHGFGLISDERIGKPATHFEYMGCEAGGACGEYDTYTDGDDWWLQRGNKRYVISSKELESILCSSDRDGLNTLERYEKKFNKMIDYIKSKAN